MWGGRESSGCGSGCGRGSGGVTRTEDDSVGGSGRGLREVMLVVIME